MKPISGKRLCKILEQRGWVRDRTRGSHYHYEHPELPGKIVVPVHANRDLAPGTQKDLMRLAGLTEADL